MRVVVALETRFERTPDGRVFGTGWLDAAFWSRYLDVFDQVGVLARVKTVAAPSLGARRADAQNVEFLDLPYYIGPWQYLVRRRRLKRAVQNALREDDAVILRAPGAISTLVEWHLERRGRPYAVEVIGDPRDVFGSGGVRSVFSPVLRLGVPRDLRRQCQRACGVAYVTEKTLQRRYPAGRSAFAGVYSSIELPQEAFADRPRSNFGRNDVLHAVLVGSLEQLYKGPDVLIGAIARCQTRGFKIEATIVGDGRQRPSLERLAAQSGVVGHVRFAGRVPPGEGVRAQLDAADLLVLPSRTEGLPRVLLEAMARGLPCLASRVGGIPELLPESDMLPPGDMEALAEVLQSVAGDPRRLGQMATRNLARAREFHADVLRPRRQEFYTRVRLATQASQLRRP